MTKFRKLVIRLEGTRISLCASILAQFAGVFGQLIATPLYLSKWSADEFSMWLVAFSVASSLALFDLGISTVGAARIIEYKSKGEIGGAAWWRRITIRLTNFGLIVLTFVVIVVPAAFEVDPFLSIDKEVYFAACVYGLSLVSFNAYINLLRAENANGLALWMGTASLFVEVFVPICLVYFWGISAVQALISVCVIRVAFCLLSGAAEYSAARGLFVAGVQTIERRGEMSSFAIDSLAAANVPIVMMVLLQAPLIILAVGSESAAAQLAALFGSMRTLCRVVFQVSFVYPRIKLPAYAAAYHSNDIEDLSRISRRLTNIQWLLVFPAAIAMLAFGPSVFDLWTSGALGFDGIAFSLLTVSAFLHAYWYCSLSLLIATGLHRLSVKFLTVIGFLFGATLLCCGAEVRSVAIVAFLAEFALAISITYCMYRANLRPLLPRFH